MKKRQAPEGHWLTQAVLRENEPRIFVKEVVGYGDLEGNFILFDDEEKMRWVEEHRIEEQTWIEFTY